MDKWLLLLAAVGFGIARFLVPVTGQLNHADIFKDAAHLVVGFMFGYAAYSKHAGEHRRELWAIAWGLTAIEITAFAVRMS